jgi:hypothetical protein
MADNRFWLISTEFTMSKLRKWHADNPDDGLPLTVKKGEELTELSVRVIRTAELLERYAEMLGGKPPVLN